MYKSIRQTLAASCLVAASLQAFAGDTPMPTQAAVGDITIADPAGMRNLQGWIWYPTADNKKATSVVGNSVWASVRAVRNAPPAVGQHPLLLVSHGMYGNINNQAWLASRLANAGYMVAAINHPGTTSRDRRRAESRRLWERPRDLSRLLDFLIASPEWGDSIDQSSIAAAGHSLGGLTVMRLAGAQGDSKAIEQLCNGGGNDFLCDVMAQLNIAQHAEDAELIDSNNLDPRVRAVISLDLGGTQTLSTASLAEVEMPVLVIGSSRGEQLDQVVESEALAAALPATLVSRFSVADTGHFDFLGECSERGLAILKDEEPEEAFICEGGQAERASKHNAYATAIADFLEGVFSR